MSFLGLASNYSAGRILRHLFAWGSPRDSLTLRQDLAARYGADLSQVTLYHSGRSALAVALQSVAAPGAKVILPGLTCIAVVRAIKAAGCVPVFSDIDPETLQYDFKALDKTLKLCYNGDNGSPSPAFPRPSHPDSSVDLVILAQNTLGLPLDIKALESLAKKHHAVIVEDLAHSAGRFYSDGREIGTVGAAAALSFGKGKAIDTICGGAVILRSPIKSARLVQPSHRPPLSTRLRDRWYPVFAGVSRTFWRLGLGKALLALAVKLHWIEKSADTALSTKTRLTHWQARLARQQLTKLPRTPLRDHYFVKNRPELLTKLRQAGYEFCEIWYDTPVSPARYALEADFPTERCPATVRVAASIINLPTWYPAARLERARAIIKPYRISPSALAAADLPATPDAASKTVISYPLSAPDPAALPTPEQWARIQQLYPEANFLQSPAWGRMNQLIGHKVLFETTLPEAAKAPEATQTPKANPKTPEPSPRWCLMIVKNAKRGRYLEVPGGPLLDWHDPEAVQQMFARIRAVARREKCVFVRLRPQLRRTPEHEQLLASLGAKKAPMHLHAEHTVILDLTQSEDDLLKAMRRQTRYEVRRALKLGITVSWSDDEASFRQFHEVQAETASRQHFVPPDLKTLLAERAAFNPEGEVGARLYVAKTAEGAPIAYGLVLISGAEAEYFEAASTELNHRLPGAYALQWQVMRDLKKLGVKRYNLWGIAPPGQKAHRYAGVTTFKTGFGGEIVEFVPAQDLVINHLRYLLNLLVETVRKKKRHL